MIKRYLVVTAFSAVGKKVTPHGYDLMEETYIKGERVSATVVDTFHFKSLALDVKRNLERKLIKNKQWLELLPPVMQYDSMTEEQMLKDYV